MLSKNGLNHTSYFSSGCALNNFMTLEIVYYSWSPLPVNVPTIVERCTAAISRQLKIKFKDGMRYHGNIVINAKWWCPINHSAVAQRTTTFNSISYNCRIESYQTMCDLPTEREYGFLLKEQFNSSHLSLPSWDDGTPHDLLTEKDVLKALASVFYGSQTTQKTPDQNLYLKYKPPTITKISSAIKPTHHNKFLVFPSSWLMFFLPLECMAIRLVRY